MNGETLFDGQVAMAGLTFPFATPPRLTPDCISSAVPTIPATAQVRKIKNALPDDLMHPRGVNAAELEGQRHGEYHTAVVAIDGLRH